jgi:hypothetical protein
MHDIDYDSLNPGIRRTVKFLRDHWFRTQDSGDGVTREFECDPGFPYVSIHIPSSASLLAESHRLRNLLASVGIEVGYQSEDGRAAAIQATYDPVTDRADILLLGVTDTSFRDMP